MIRYAVVFFYPARNIGLYSKTYKDGIKDIVEAEQLRINGINEYHFDPQNVQVISYRTDS